MRKTTGLSLAVFTACALLPTAALAWSTPAPPAPPGCVVIKRGGLGNITDTYIWSAFPDSNNGSEDRFYSGTSLGGEQRALVGFDLAPIPDGSTITSATLWVPYTGTYGAPAYQVRLHRVTAPWTESTVKWSTFGGIDPIVSAWSTFDPAVVATMDAETGVYVWGSFEIGSLVQSWVAGGVPNHGVLLTQDLTAKTTYVSSEAGLIGVPELHVCYSPPDASIGDTVWYDANDNGVQDEGEPGIPGVSIQLFSDTDCDGTADGLLATTSTSASGVYGFTSLPGGCYVVAVDEATVPEGYVTSTFNSPLAVSVAGGQAYDEADFGYTTLESIGDQVWVDSNGNGLFEPELGEAGINGVVVDLYEGEDLVASTVTANNPLTGNPGYYLFADLYPGPYTVVIHPANFDAGGPLAAYEGTFEGDGTVDGSISHVLQGGEDYLDADFAYQLQCGNGVCQPGETCSSCAQDCGACPPVCGDNVCDLAESCSDCAFDCGVCPPECGDGTCDEGETCDTCESDCGACPEICGDGACEIGESCSTCVVDCGACPPVCGDGVCGTEESCETCSTDCGTCPPPPAAGTGTIGYWKNHPQAWPVEQLTIGGVVYTKAQLIDIIAHPPKGDVTYILAPQLIAAKLNVGIGNVSTCITSTIAAADAWLVTNKLGSNVKGGAATWKNPGESLKNTLDSYNNGNLCAPHRN